MTVAPARRPLLWLARLDDGDWPGAEGLPTDERERAAALPEGSSRERWIAARWALRRVLGECLGCPPEAVELRLAEHGKPELTDSAAGLRFNLSHSGELALIAAAHGVEVGIDVQRIGKRPAAYYERWVRREAIAKCHGAGLWRPLPATPVTVTAVAVPPGHVAALAVAGDAPVEPSPLRDVPAHR